MTAGLSKSSPEVWAAVKILSEFLRREKDLAGALPDRVVTSIIHLTEFLQADGQSPAQTRLREQLEAQGRSKKERISQILRAQSSVEQFMMTEADPGLFQFSTLPVQ